MPPRQLPGERISSWSGEENGGEGSRGILHGAPALGLTFGQVGLTALTVLDEKLLGTTLKVSAVKTKTTWVNTTSFIIILAIGKRVSIC